MRILAIDPAQHCGWAVASVKDRIDASGVWNIGAEAQNRPGHLGFLLRRHIERYRPAVIAFEVATFGTKNPHVMRRHNELAGVIHAVASEFRCDCWPFGITSWKARAVGNGNAKKDAVMRGLRLFYRIDVCNDNEADAIGIALAAQMGPPPEPAKKAKSRIRKAAKREPRLFR